VRKFCCHFLNTQKKTEQEDREREIILDVISDSIVTNFGRMDSNSYESSASEGDIKWDNRNAALGKKQIFLGQVISTQSEAAARYRCDVIHTYRYT